MRQTSKLLIIIFILFCFTKKPALAQGCSDAGFCTMGALKPDQGYSKKISIKLRSIEFSQYIGLTRFNDNIFNYTLDASIGINEKNTIQIKIPYVFVDGVVANTNGIGDLSIGFARNLVNRDNYQINLTLGTKIPTGKDDILTDEGRTLPLYYQTGLGTFDFIAGISLITGKWLIATGYQHSFNQIDNKFLWDDWNGHSEEAFVRENYKQSINLNRGKDIMLRVERNFRFSNFNFNIGLLPIYRLNKDELTLPDGNKVKVDGSDGLALTLLIGGGYQFSVRSGIKIMNGFRIERRSFNPDGLSREFVSNIGYVYRF